MTYTRGLLKAAMVAAPLAVVGFGAQAADVAGTIQNQKQFSTFAKAIKAAGMADSLKGGGPYTIFAPTDQAFAQLPPGTMNYLMQQGNQDQLKSLLQYHVVKGKQLKADQVIGKQTKVSTLEGDSLSVDGKGRMVLLVPTGLTVTRVGDQVVVKREVAAMSAPAVEVAPAGQGGQQNGTQAGGNGQQQASNAGQQQQSGGNAGESYQRPASAPDNGAEQQARTDVTQQSNMPASKHQEEVLRQHPKTEQQQTMAATEGAMPSTKHQRQVLRGQQPGEQGGNGQMAARESGQSPGAQNQGALREATVIGGPIKADNGVIYVIDAVLVPQSILSQVKSHAQQGQGQGQMQNGQQGQNQQNKS